MRQSSKSEYFTDLPDDISIQSQAPARLIVDLAAIRENYLLLKVLSGTAECAVVLKANAYGLGVQQVAPELYSAGARTFFVAFLSEALVLKKSLGTLNDVTIYVLEGNAPDSEQDFLSHQFIPVVNSLEQLARWKSHCERSGTSLPCGLHVDTGMNRLGLAAHELYAVFNRSAGHEICLVISHLSCANDEHSVQNCSQLKKFMEVKNLRPDLRFSLSNSSGIILGGEYLFDMTRAGVALFGVNPTLGKALAIKPVVKLEARLTQMRTIEAGETIGYGATYKSHKRMKLGTLSIGYADGYLRSLSGSTAAAYWGKNRFPLVGRVSMDSIVVNFGDIESKSPDIGDYLSLINEEFGVNDIADKAGTIGQEILTCLGSRLDWQYINKVEKNSH